MVLWFEGVWEPTCWTALGPRQRGILYIGEPVEGTRKITSGRLEGRIFEIRRMDIGVMDEGAFFGFSLFLYIQQHKYIDYHLSV